MEFVIIALTAAIGAAFADLYKKGRDAGVALINDLRERPDEVVGQIDKMSDEQIGDILGSDSKVSVDDVRKTAAKANRFDILRVADELEKSPALFESVEDIRDFNKYLAENNSEPWPRVSR